MPVSMIASNCATTANELLGALLEGSLFGPGLQRLDFQQLPQALQELKKGAGGKWIACLPPSTPILPQA